MQNTLKTDLQRVVDAGISQEAIAAKTGVHQTTISRILKGSGCRMGTYLSLMKFLSEFEHESAA